MVCGYERLVQPKRTNKKIFIWLLWIFETKNLNSFRKQFTYAVAFTKKETHTHTLILVPPLLSGVSSAFNPFILVCTETTHNHIDTHRHTHIHSHTHTHTFIFVRAHTSQLRTYIHAYSHTHCTNAVQESAPHACKLRARAPHSNALSLYLSLHISDRRHFLKV